MPYRAGLTSNAGRNERLWEKAAVATPLDPPPIGTNSRQSCRRDQRSHLPPSRVTSRCRGGSLAPSNVLLIGLAICCLTLSPVQPRQNHHQTCPGCPHQQQQHQHMHETHRGGGSKDTAAPTPDDLRLEAIKHQILTKLGLRARPDVNRTLATVPRHLALETLYRAEAQSTRFPERPRNDHENEYSSEFLYGGDEYSYRNLDQQEDTADENAKIGYGEHETQDAQEEMDDFYARTSEIITFAEPGEYTPFHMLVKLISHASLSRLSIFQRVDNSINRAKCVSRHVRTRTNTCRFNDPLSVSRFRTLNNVHSITASDKIVLNWLLL